MYYVSMYFLELYTDRKTKNNEWVNTDDSFTVQGSFVNLLNNQNISIFHELQTNIRDSHRC